MIKYHQTADGTYIPIKDLTDIHLSNIIKMIERKAKEGMTVGTGGGHGDYEEMWADFEDIEGEDVLDHLNYDVYKKEQRRRSKQKKDVPN